MTSRWTFLTAVLVVSIARLVPEASAHSLADGGRGVFLGALLHPLTALDHGFALIAVGLLAGQQGWPDARAIITAVVLGLALGAGPPLVLGVTAGAPPWVTSVNLGSLLVLGVLVAAARRLPLALLAAVAGLVGFSHGLENGLDLAAHGAPARAMVGVTSAGLVTAPVAAVVTTLRAGWARIAVRVVGSWIAAIGLMMLGVQLRGD